MSTTLYSLSQSVYSPLKSLRNQSLFILICTVSLLSLNATQSWANPKIQKPIKRLIKAIQYNKDAVALKSFHGQLQGSTLIGPSWEKKSSQQQELFIKHLHQFFTLMAFPKLRADLKHLETIVYKEPVIKGDFAQIEAVIVVLHALKKQEIPVVFDLYKNQKNWQIVEFKIGDAQPFLAQLKTTQIQPLLEKRGWDGLLKAMQARIDQLTKK